MNDEPKVIIFDKPIDAPGTPFDGVTGLVQRYDWIPYGYWRVITLLRDHYRLEVENLWQGYKSNRRPGYQELYRLKDISTGEIVVPITNMRTMQQFLAHQGFPQYAPKVKRNPGAVAFLEAVDAIQKRGENHPE